MSEREPEDRNDSATEIEITDNDAFEPDESGPVNPVEGGKFCSQCEAPIPPGQEVTTENAVFCPACYRELTEILERSLAEQGRNIRYPGAVLGGILGGMLGAGIWWGFTVVTRIQFGLVAIVVGWAVGKGVVAFAGGKRALSLQIVSVIITLASYGLANYWVVRTYVQRYIAENGLTGGLPLLPGPALFKEVMVIGFQAWDLVFLAIALWQAWKLPAPVVLRKDT